MKKRTLIISAALAAILLSGLACDLASKPTPTPVPTATPVPVEEPAPTDTPLPTPTDEPAPTETPEPELEDVSEPEAEVEAPADPGGSSGGQGGAPADPGGGQGGQGDAPPLQPPTDCECTGDSLDCSDFTSQQEAQTCYLFCSLQGLGDVHQLQPDASGMVCLSLPQ